MAELSEKDRDKIINNNRTICHLLQANEKILISAGFRPPVENFAFDSETEAWLRMQIPSGYIRSKDYYLKKYQLNKICNNNFQTASNIAYSLQISDFYNYILNRFGLYGSVLAMLYKHATINIVSIIEVMFKTFLKTLQQTCKKCEHRSMCNRKITRKLVETTNFSKIVEIYKEKTILEANDENALETVGELYKYRNYIHIIVSEDNELTGKKHTVDQYNKAIRTLVIVNEAMKQCIKTWVENEDCQRYLEDAEKA